MHKLVIIETNNFLKATKYGENSIENKLSELMANLYKIKEVLEKERLNKDES
ncbi:MAG TPA: hypothetical protein PKD85_01715 [Saprospiraceae bacterium]|nr:hypothetical protein [Saprospiraceae bacterium]